MPHALTSLTIILLVATVAPLISKLIPGNIMPEVVLLLLGGALLGQHGAGLILNLDSVEMLSQLGLAFLFLLAGYEINPKTLSGHVGRSGMLTWIVTFAIACALVLFAPGFASHNLNSMPVAIAMCTTALGTLIPILADRDLTGTTVGDAILAYGTWGELLPIIAMALLLSTRAKWQTALVLGGFALLCIVLAVIPKQARKAGSALFRFMEGKAAGNSQLLVRATALLLVALVAATAVFDLDAVLGAFAAGFVLRYIIPEGNEALEYKLHAIGYGFFIPIFFVVSGTKIDLRAVAAAPGLLIGFIVMLLLVRAVPVFCALTIDPQTRSISTHHRITVALYCATALPLIVAVTDVAVNSGQMVQNTASVLVAAGAVTVFLMPLLGSLTYRVADTHPFKALRKISHDPRDFERIVREHRDFSRLLAHEEMVERQAAQSGPEGAAVPFGPQVFAAAEQEDAASARSVVDVEDFATAATADNAAPTAAVASATTATATTATATTSTDTTADAGTATDTARTAAGNATDTTDEAAAEEIPVPSPHRTHIIIHTVNAGKWRAWDEALRQAAATEAAHANAEAAYARSDESHATEHRMLEQRHRMTERRLELARRVIAERNKRLRELGIDPSVTTKNARSDQFFPPAVD
ncbi:Kef-type K+ transport system membrane component KefB [Pseudoscardovia suis]|uniref:Potassium transporter n=2 Tax=Pseudoscardovia suis TaxID=987063 RepID=A0A261F4F0_9BIFI|nr:potassium transporter [Pseudoscardovia suis]PJJ65790.1 Kef-type K+ transport system membrane component KefB [Pseudoscardovia suis]